MVLFTKTISYGHQQRRSSSTFLIGHKHKKLTKDFLSHPSITRPQPTTTICSLYWHLFVLRLLRLLHNNNNNNKEKLHAYLRILGYPPREEEEDNSIFFFFFRNEEQVHMYT
jgi:hypothetical protein